MKYNTILMDADDTLLDFKLAEHNALIKTLKSFSIDFNDTVISAYSRINDGYWKRLEKGEVTKVALRIKRFEDLCTEFGYKCDASQMASAYESALSEMAYVLDGADELCRALSQKYRIYIVTNGIKEVQKERLKGSKINGMFLDAFVSEEIGYEKPRVEYFERVADKISDFDKSKTVIIGDSLSSDIKGGIAFGIDTCWYNPKGKEKPSDIDITYIASSFDDIKKLFL